MFSFRPIKHNQYAFVMIVASGLLLAVIANFTKSMEVLSLAIGCAGRRSLCEYITTDFPQRINMVAIMLFLIVTTIAGLRRVRASPISSYWVLLLSLLIFLDHSYFTGLSRIWAEDFNHGLFTGSLPWFLMAAVSLAFLLCMLPDNSTYFIDGYWKADPPLGFGLLISSFWLLSFSATRALAIIANAIDNQVLLARFENTWLQLEAMLPFTLISPIVPAVVFTTCAILLSVLSMLRAKTAKIDPLKTSIRQQNATQVTRAAQNFTHHNQS